MLKLEAVCKNYNHSRNAVTAIKDVELVIPKGDFISIIGPSGSGKSTLLLILGGMMTPSSGQVYIEDQSLYELSPDERTRLRKEKLGFLFQTFNLMPYLSALENVQIPLFLAGEDNEAQRIKATRLLERVGLGDRLDHKPSELSVGQQQRVALARVLANDPEIILADEPTGNLDPETTQHVVKFFDEINQDGKTIIMVTHDPIVAQKAKRIYKLIDGSVTSEGNKEYNHVTQSNKIPIE